MKKYIICVLILCVHSLLYNSYGQPEINLIASKGTFSVSPKQGHIPKILSSFHVLKVDSNSCVILNMPVDGSISKTYVIVGQAGTIQLSNLPTDVIINSNESFIWETEIEKLANPGKKSIAINCTLENEELRTILEKLGFDYLPNYPNIINLDFKWSELSQNEGNDEDISSLVGETDFSVFSDTVSVSTTKPEKVINQEFSFLVGKWKMLINGTEAVLNLDSVNFELNGNIIFKNRELHELQELNFFEPFIGFNLQKKTTLRKVSLPFVAQIDMTKPNKMYGIFEDNNTIHTWSAIMMSR
jgi:hypothetical protein